jgi:UDP-sulfoquinovose synthase
MKKVLVLGGDGYLGWPTVMHLSNKGHEVGAVDNFFRRSACHELGAEPLIPVPTMLQRARIWSDLTGKTVGVAVGDILDYEFLAGVFTGSAFDDPGVFRDGPPDAVIHYAEQPAAPYSMMGRKRAAFTVKNNLLGTLNLIHAVKEFNPDCHIIKLGTMGVYGTPNIDIEEGYLEVVHKDRRHTFLYPKTPGSLYHLTKAQDGDMLYFYVRMWSLRVTDLNQGPVYGVDTDQTAADERLKTIFNYDAVFGTVLNRFLVQAACGFPLTIYGKGNQIRGYLDIRDTLNCVELSMLNLPERGTYRVFNQFVETFSVNELAKRVTNAGRSLGLDVTTEHIRNPRLEAEEHYYNPTHTGLLGLGLQPHYLTNETMVAMLEEVLKHRQNIDERVILPHVSWT